MGDLQVAQRDLEVVLEILRTHIPEIEVWAFGSRVHGENLKPFSDLDLVLINKTPLDINLLTSLKDAFTESTLPFKVDLIDWSTTNEHFRRLIRQNYLVVQRAGTPMETNK